MVVRVVVLASLIACTGDERDEPDVGVPLPQCKECGPGALRAGRRYSSLRSVGANRSGTIVGVSNDGLVWLRDDFTREHSMPFAHENVGFSIDDAGGVVVTIGPPDDLGPATPSYTTPVTALAPDHSTKWKTSTGAFFGALANTEIVLLSSPAYPALIALHAADGSAAWSKRGPSYTSRLGFAVDGTLIVAGTFSGTLDLGGTAQALVATGMDVFVAAIEPSSGSARWATRIDVTDETAFPILNAFGLGPNGEIAVSWADTGGPSLSLIDAVGTVRWTLAVPLINRMNSLIPNGDLVLATTLTGGESAVAAYSANGVEWRRVISAGAGWREVSLLELVGDRLLASIKSVGDATGPTTTTIGDVTYDGSGLAVVELVH